MASSSNALNSLKNALVSLDRNYTKDKNEFENFIKKDDIKQIKQRKKSKSLERLSSKTTSTLNHCLTTKLKLMTETNPKKITEHIKT